MNKKRFIPHAMQAECTQLKVSSLLIYHRHSAAKTGSATTYTLVVLHAFKKQLPQEHALAHLVVSSFDCVLKILELNQKALLQRYRIPTLPRSMTRSTSVLLVESKSTGTLGTDPAYCKIKISHYLK